MEVSVSQRVYRKYPGDFLFIPAAALTCCAVLTVAARIPLFWDLPRIARAALIIVIGLVLTPAVMASASCAWRKLMPYKSWNSYVLPALLFAAGISAGWLDLWPVRFPQTLHTVHIAISGPSGSEVRVLEVRNAEGEKLPPDTYRLMGEWEQEGGAYIARSGQSSSLTVQFLGSDEGSGQVMLAEGPNAGEVTVTIDRTSQQVSLKTEVDSIRLVEASLLGKSKIGSLLYLAWFITVGIILPMSLIAAVPNELLSGPPSEKYMEWANGVHSTRHVVFIVAIFLMVLQPLRGIKTLENFDKKFWGREKLLRAFTDFRYAALGDRIFNSYLIGNDRWLMFTGELSLDDFQNTKPLSEHELRLISEGVDALDERLSNHGIRLLVVITPNKNTIYPEKMPDFVPIIGEQSRLDQLMVYQQEHGKAQILDLRPALMEAKDERQIYYSTDTHWNPYGAYVGYREIMSALEGDFSALHPHALEEYRYVSREMRGGDIASTLSQLTVEEEYFSLVPKFSRPALMRMDTKNTASKSIITFAHPDDSLPRLVMYRDSYAVELLPFFVDHFSRAVFISHFNVDEALIYSEQPDIVIIEVTERILNALINLPR